jgi:hypothetical protein
MAFMMGFRTRKSMGVELIVFSPGVLYASSFPAIKSMGNGAGWAQLLSRSI